MVDSSKLGKSGGQLDAQYTFGLFSDVAVPLNDNSEISVYQDILQQFDALNCSSDIKGTQLGKSVQSRLFFLQGKQPDVYNFKPVHFMPSSQFVHVKFYQIYIFIDSNSQIHANLIYLLIQGITFSAKR